MKRVSSCREICAAVGAAVSRGWLLQQGGNHRKLRSPGGVMLTIPTTPSDHRASLRVGREPCEILEKVM